MVAPDTTALQSDLSDLSYESASAELESWVRRMESGDLPLEDLLSGYRRATDLLNHCRQKLQAVEAQVRVLEDGQLKDWHED
jgi:exodeoxyribonuclease VII small subunit